MIASCLSTDRSSYAVISRQREVNCCEKKRGGRGGGLRFLKHSLPPASTVPFVHGTSSGTHNKWLTYGAWAPERIYFFQFYSKTNFVHSFGSSIWNAGLYNGQILPVVQMLKSELFVPGDFPGFDYKDWKFSLMGKNWDNTCSIYNRVEKQLCQQQNGSGDEKYQEMFLTEIIQSSKDLQNSIFFFAVVNRHSLKWDL